MYTNLIPSFLKESFLEDHHKETQKGLRKGLGLI